MRGAWRIMQGIRKADRMLALRRAQQAVAAFPLTRNRTRHDLETPVVVSLTSYPPRFATLGATLRSLLDQTALADRTVLWIAHADFALLPRDVLSLERHGLEIRQCEDIGPYKKLVPALQAFPDATIITADDDVYYPPDWLESLLGRAGEKPGCVLAHRVHRARLGSDGRLTPYQTWTMAVTDTADSPPDCLVFPTGDCGILYPPGSLDPRVTDAALFMALCPRADDLWFFWMARLAGTGHRGMGHAAHYLTWEGTQEVALCVANWLGNGNDPQIAAMEDHFGTLREIAMEKSPVRCREVAGRSGQAA